MTEHAYLVVYQPLNRRCQDKSDRIKRALGAIGSRWWHWMDRTWIVFTNQHDYASSLTNYLTAFINHDSLLVVKLPEQPDYNGQLNPNAWAWLDTAFGKGAASTDRPSPEGDHATD